MDNQFIVCVYIYINVDISNQLVVLNPEWAMIIMIYIYYLFVKGIFEDYLYICLQCLVM